MLDGKLRKRLSEVDRSKFRHDYGFRTSSLFRDHPTKAVEPEFCMFYINREFSNDEYIALKEVYMQIADPTEYEFAMVVFGSFKHWKLLSDLFWTKDKVAEWRDELEIKLKSQAVLGIADMAYDPEIKETTKLQSLKWLASSEFAEKKTKTAKAKEEKEQAIVSGVIDNVRDDFERLGIETRSLN